MSATVNGSTPSSAFIHHLVSYPVISDSISTFKSNPYGAKSLEIADGSYNIITTRAKPILPYVHKGYSFVSPYVTKADSIGDSALGKVDNTFPIVKKPTAELYDDAAGMVTFPFKITLDGKDYVLKTYNSEYKKVGGEGIRTMGTAAFTTTLIVGSDVLTWLSTFLSKKKEEAKEMVNEKTAN